MDRNLAPVEGGERAMRTIYLPAFQKGCVNAGALAIMTAYSSYDGVPAVSNSRKYFDSGTPDKMTYHRLSHYEDTLKDIVRNFPLAPLPFIKLTMSCRSFVMNGATSTGSLAMPDP